jgi:hypothetical protein
MGRPDSGSAAGRQARSLRFLQPGDGRSFPRCETGVEERGETGFQGITWHTFRHTFASRLTRNGADPLNVRDLAGTFDDAGEQAFERPSEASGVG